MANIKTCTLDTVVSQLYPDNQCPEDVSIFSSHPTSFCLVVASDSGVSSASVLLPAG
jgi:hypothetical protein